MKKDKIDTALLHCYRQLYAHSTPAANFDKLLEEAKTNQFGQKVIDFMSYELDEELFRDILEQTIVDYKIKNYQKQMFRNTIFLGCSPKFKKKDEDESKTQETT